MIASFLVGEGGGSGRSEEGNLALDWLYSRRFGGELPDRGALLGHERRKANRITIDQAEIAATADLACACADAIGRLREALAPEIAEKGMAQLFNEIEMPLVSVLARMELAGVAVDTGSLHEMGESLSQEIHRLEDEIYKSVGHEFNVGSPAQLSDVLFDEIGLPKTRRLKSGAHATDKNSLEAMRGVHPIIDLIFSYRELTKLKSTYLDPLPFLVNPKTKRIHTEFNQTGAATGRLSSSNPNLQNIPVRGEIGAQVRRAFIARDTGKKPQLLSADYSQVELRIMAHITQDPALTGAFERDEDIHAATAAQVFGVPLDEVTTEMRRRAKVFNFGVLYGLSEYGLSLRERIPREEAAAFIETYFEKYPGIQQYVSDTVTKVRLNGYAETLFGRRRYIPEISAGNRNVREAAERAAVNMPVQGTAADIIKIAMNRLDTEIRDRKLRRAGRGARALPRHNAEEHRDGRPTQDRHQVRRQLGRDGVRRPRGRGSLHLMWDIVIAIGNVILLPSLLPTLLDNRSYVPRITSGFAVVGLSFIVAGLIGEGFVISPVLTSSAIVLWAFIYLFRGKTPD